jgi:tRNA threonylcarbamoyladenosine biosynthesis protein TsaE
VSGLVVDQRGLEAVAVELAGELPAGAVIRLEGPLGAGKTTFARAFVVARGAATEATSPTYTLAHRYDGPRGEIWHLDCYRLREPEEAADLDWERFTSADVLLIEWPERAGPWVPAANCTVRLDHVDEDTRRVALLT